MGSNKKPLVSFIIAYYNLPSEMLCECIESILSIDKLPREDKEIIVVDDGSSVSPIQAAGALMDEVVYVRQKNRGLSAARNTGLSAATGEYIQFVDADDKMMPAAYGHCIDILRHDSPDMLMFDFTNSDASDGGSNVDSPMMTGHELMRSQNIKGAAWAYLFRKRILGDLRFTVGIYHEDEEFTPLLLLRANTVVKTSAKAYFYRVREGSIMTSASLRRRLKRLSDVEQALFRLQLQAATLPPEYGIALNRRVHQLTMDYIYNIIVLTRSRHYLLRKTERLRSRGLYPLPPKGYTLKYRLFSRLANSKTGLGLLMLAVPLLKKA